MPPSWRLKSSSPGMPIDDSARLAVKIVKDATLKIYPGAPHGLTATHKDHVNEELLAFLRS